LVFRVLPLQSFFAPFLPLWPVAAFYYALFPVFV